MFATANPIAYFHLSVSLACHGRTARGSSPRAVRPASPRQWLTVDDVAAELGINEKTVRRWIHAGKLTAKRVGKGLRIHRFAVAALLDRDPVGPQLPQRRRGGQLKQLPPSGIRDLYRERERRAQEGRAHYA